jgi:beta-galactosidase
VRRRATVTIGTARFEYGVAWYPEWCSAGEWRKELEDIAGAGFTSVRIGEFAWETIEPEAGHFRFDLYDEVLAEIEHHEMTCVLGVDTVRPPLWVFEEHPDLHLVDDRGNVPPGTWPAHCFNHPAFRELSSRYIEAFVSRYRGSPALRMYQVDNEPAYHAHNLGLLADSWFCYCTWCQQGYRDWLDERYGTSGRRPGVTAPFPRPHEMGELGWLEWRLFHDATNLHRVRWAKQEVHRHDPEHPVTTNIMLGSGFQPDSSKLAHDVVALAKQLDVMGMDFYPQMGSVPADRGAMVFSLADQLGGVAGFECLETQATTYDTPEGHWVGQERGFRATAPSEVIAPQFWRIVAYGARSLYYWAWRLNSDNVWALARPDGSPRDVVNKTSKLAQDLQRLWPVLKGARRLKARAAVVFNRLSVHASARHGLADAPGDRIVNAFAAARRYFEPVDLIDVSDEVPDLSAYALVVVPFLYVLDRATEVALCRYVEQGGTLLWGGARGGSYGEPEDGWREVPNGSRRVLPNIGVPPGELAPVLGYRRLESLLASREDGCVLADDFVIPSGLWREDVEVDARAEVVARTEGGSPALVRHQHGIGVSWSLLVDGFSSSGPPLAQLVGLVSSRNEQAQGDSLREGREVVHRSLPGAELLFLINGSAEPWQYQVAIHPGQRVEDLLNGREPIPRAGGKISEFEVAAWSAAVIRVGP